MVKHTVKGQVWANWKGQNSSLHEDVFSLFALEAAVAYSLLFALLFWRQAHLAVFVSSEQCA